MIINIKPFYLLLSSTTIAKHAVDSRLIEQALNEPENTRGEKLVLGNSSFTCE
jgi:hypothetical protein